MADRGDYRSFYCSFWDNADTHALSDRGYRVLTTLKGTLNAAGIGVVYPGLLAERCGKTSQEIADAFGELEEIKAGDEHGWIRREKNIVWIVNGLRYEPSLTSSNKNHRSFVRQRCLAPLGEAPIVVAFRHYYPEWFVDTTAMAGISSGDGSGMGQRYPSKQIPAQPSPTHSVPVQSNPVQSSPNQPSPEPAPLLTAAANRGIREAFGEQPSPIRHDAGASLLATETILTAGVPLAFAVDAVYTIAREPRDEPPRSLKYFTNAVIDRWKAHNANAAAGSSTAKSLPAANGSGEASSFVEAIARSSRHG